MQFSFDSELWNARPALQGHKSLCVAGPPADWSSRWLDLDTSQVHRHERFFWKVDVPIPNYPKSFLTQTPRKGPHDL